MKTFIRYLFITTFFIRSVTAQNVIASIDSIGVYDLQARLVGDSIFMSYWYGGLQGQKGGLFAKRELVTEIVDREGNNYTFDFKELREKQIVSIVNSADSVIFYYNDKKNPLTLHSLSIHRQSLNRKTHRAITTMQGNLLGMVEDNKNLFLISLLANKSGVRIVQVYNSTVLSEKTFPVEIDPDFAKSYGSVIRESIYVKPSEAKTRLKVYKQNDDFLLSLEFDAGTVRIIKLNYVSGSIWQNVFPGISSDYSTFISKNLLFIIEKMKGFRISMYDWSEKKLLKTFVVDKNHPMNKEMAYLRNDEVNGVVTNRNVWDAIANNAGPFVTVYPLDSAAFLLKVGTDKAVIKSSVPILLGLTGGIGLLIAVGAVATLHKGNSLDHYYYLKGNLTGEFTYSDGTGSIDKDIDNFELDLRPDVKAYLSGPKSTFAIYNFGGDIRIVRFDRH